MKKSILLLILSITILFSCSKSDDTKTETVQNYTITVVSNCTSSGSGGTENTYCISKSTYETIMAVPLRPCPYHSFKTLDGQNKGGYLTSIGPSASCK